MALDEPLEERIANIVAPLAKRWPNIDPEAIAPANRKQATIPDGRHRSRAGRHRARARGRAPAARDGRDDAPTSSSCRARRVSCSRCGAQALADEALRAGLRGRDRATASGTLRLFGIPESEIAETLRVAERDGVELGSLEVTTCLKRGEVEVVTRYEPPAAEVYEAFVELVRAPSRRRALLRRRRAPSTSTSRRCCAGTDRIPRARSPPPSRAPAGCSRRA